MEIKFIKSEPVVQPPDMIQMTVTLEEAKVIRWALSKTTSGAAREAGFSKDLSYDVYSDIDKIIVDNS